MVEPFSLIVLAVVAAVLMFITQGRALPFLALAVEEGSPSKRRGHEGHDSEVHASYKGQALNIETPHGDLFVSKGGTAYYRPPETKRMYRVPSDKVVPWVTYKPSWSKHPHKLDMPTYMKIDQSIFKSDKDKEYVASEVEGDAQRFDDFTSRLEAAVVEHRLKSVHIKPIRKRVHA